MGQHTTPPLQAVSVSSAQHSQSGQLLLALEWKLDNVSGVGRLVDMDSVVFDKREAN